MLKLQVKMKNIDDLFELVKLTGKMSFDVDLVCGMTAIDLKSIIGVANVDLSKTYTLEILVDETKKTEELNNYLQFVNKFKLEEKNEKQRTD